MTAHEDMSAEELRRSLDISRELVDYMLRMPDAPRAHGSGSVRKLRQISALRRLWLRVTAPWVRWRRRQEYRRVQRALFICYPEPRTSPLIMWVVIACCLLGALGGLLWATQHWTSP